ncbi:MAG: lactonase family protein [Acaryochloridaceae cyanobacterium RL_2_7]|nr:lactonase family protein [Acaryochloridaceae cyanobacterium RL_2_7]
MLYNLSQQDGTLSIIDTSNFRNGLIQTIRQEDLIPNRLGNDVFIEGLDGASALAVSNDDRFLYVTGQNSNTLTVFERQADQTLRLVETLKMEWRVSVDSWLQRQLN